MPADTLSAELREQKKRTIMDIMNAVEERNRGIEADTAWINGAYQGLSIAKLNTLSPEQYDRYRTYVDNGSVYIFVHPSYSLFFHEKNPRALRGSADLRSSIVDSFLESTPESAVMLLEQEQLRAEKKFIEYLTTVDKLVILVLPRDYLHAMNYAYLQGPDEYARYLNGIANGSPAILYMESESSNSGKLLADDLIPLLSFLKAVGAQTTLIGGGYVGRCQKEFYQYVTNFTAADRYYIVPELSTFSPQDIAEDAASGFIENTRLNLQACAAFVRLLTQGDVRIRHLPPHYRDFVLQKDTAGLRAELTEQGDQRGQGASSAPTAFITPAAPVTGIGSVPGGDNGDYAL
jgi:hypothetical protein